MTDADPDLVARARALRPLIEAEAEEAEATGTTQKRVVDAVAEQQLFWVMVPRRSGGRRRRSGRASASSRSWRMPTARRAGP